MDPASRRLNRELTGSQNGFPETFPGVFDENDSYTFEEVEFVAMLVALFRSFPRSDCENSLFPMFADLCYSGWVIVIHGSGSWGFGV